MDLSSTLNEAAGYLDGKPVTLAQAILMDRDSYERMMQVKQASSGPIKSRYTLRDRQFEQVGDDEVDYDFESPNQWLGTHTNLIPMQSAVAGPRIFYGARFANQALPVLKPEAPLVQALVDNDPDGRSFDDLMGMHAGAERADDDGTVDDVTPDYIDWRNSKGEKKRTELYNRQPFNRKTQIHQTSMVQPGSQVTRGQVLAKSNYTDDNGTLAMGLNARVGLVPYLGKSMDDAVVISESFAKRLTSNSLYGHDLDYKRGVKGGKAHYTGIFPNKFVNDQLDKLDDDGVIKPGLTVNFGDPIVLATRPRVVSSTNAQFGLLSKHMKNARTDAVILWDHESPGIVRDVSKLRSGVKVNIEADSPTKVGDKLTERSGNKGIVSEIIPDERMPRTLDGSPLEILLNPLGLPSRVNTALLYEALLGKIARKRGTPYKLPTFNGPDDDWQKFVESELAAAGVNKTEEVFDPAFNRKLENPITVGDIFVQKLHHVGESKISARGQGAYTLNEQPAHGGGATAKAKRLSGLESHSLLSAGAYGVLREGATLRGQRNDSYWRDLRMGQTPKEPGSPFVWDKFKALLTGAGYLARKLPGGVERLQFFTDRDLDKVQTKEVTTGDLVDVNTMEPVQGGLFDPALTGSNGWGHIALPFPVVNPAAEDVVRKLLGLTEKQYRAILSGEIELPAHLQ